MLECRFGLPKPKFSKDRPPLFQMKRVSSPFRKLLQGRISGVLSSCILLGSGSSVTMRAQGDLPLMPVSPQSGGLSLRMADPSGSPAPLPLGADSGANGLSDLLPSFPSVPPGPILPDEPDLFELNMRRRVNPTLVPDGPNPTEDAAVSLDLRHRFQIARARAMEDPAVREALAASKNVRTDRELRAALRRHYTLLFARIRALDSSLESLVKERETAALAPLVEAFPRANSSVSKESAAVASKGR